MKTTNTHVYFWEGPFSNWHPAEIVDPINGNKFANTEQGFMWYKATFFGDKTIAESILNTSDPAVVKHLGRIIRGYNDKAWETVRLGYMNYVNYLKYSQDEGLKKILIETGEKILVEASPYDKVWGVGLSENDEKILESKHWQGRNLLGISLMIVRDMVK